MLSLLYIGRCILLVLQLLGFLRGHGSCLIGNLHQMAASCLPHRCMADLANKYGPIMHLKLGQLSAIVISSPEFVQEVLKKHDVAFSQWPKFLAGEIVSYNCSNLILCPYNDFWRQMRKICMLELLSAKRVESFASIRQEEASNLVQSISLSKGHPFNLSEMIFSMLNIIIARAALGTKCKYQQEFLSLLEDTVRLGAEFDVPDLFPLLKFLRYVINLKPAIEKVHQKMDKILDEIIRDHRAKRNKESAAAGDDHQEDIVDVPLRLQESRELQFDLTTTQIKAVTLDMFSAGSETSSTTTEWAMAELLRSPRAMKKAQAEVRQLVGGKGKIEESDIKKLDYLKLVIRETLRLHPPPFIPRQASQKCTIGGMIYQLKQQSSSMLGDLGETPSIGRMLIVFCRRDSKALPLIFEGPTSNWFHLGVAGECVQAYHLQPQVLNLHFLICFTTLTGNSPMQMAIAMRRSY